MNYDVVIIGAGPAGATLARLLPKELKVAIIDKKTDADDSFKKPCGGLLAPKAQKDLGRLGLLIPREILTGPQVSMVRTIDMETGRERFYQRIMLNTDRHKFDKWMISKIPRRVSHIKGARCSEIVKENGLYTVTYSVDGRTAEINTKYIVGADGANSIVRKTFAPKPIRQYTSIQKTYRVNRCKPHFVCFFNHKLSDSYGWINIKDGVIQLGAALPKKNARDSFRIIEDYFANQGYDFSRPVGEEACLVNFPSSVDEISLGNGNAFLIGEAAGYVSSSSLEGISFALESAAELAYAFRCDCDIMSGYKRRSAKIYLKLLTKIAKGKVLYSPTLRNLALISGLTSVKFYKKAD